MLNKLSKLMVTLCVSATVFGQFSTPAPLTTLPISSDKIHTADINGDGHIDIVQSNDAASFDYTNSIVWYSNDGSGNFHYEKAIHSRSASDLSVADMDSDGDADIVFCSIYDSKVKIAYNLGGGEFGMPETVATFSEEPRRVVAYDADNDGDIDIICTISNTHPLQYIEHTGSLFATPVEFGQNVNDLKGFYTRDIDNDGDMDGLYLLWGALYKITNNGSAPTANQLLVNPANGISGLTFADTNNDGLDDVILSNSQGIRLYLNNGSGLSASGQLLSTLSGVYDISAGDIDQDGDIDLACNILTNELHWLENTGAATFTDHFISTSYPAGVYLDDLDNDNYPELLFSGDDDSFISCHRNNAGAFGEIYRIANQNPWSSKTAHGDVNSDGFEDIVYSIVGGIYLIPGRANGTFAAPELLYYDGSSYMYHYMAVHDMDNDGDLDVIGSCVTNTTTTIFTNDGSGNITLTASVSAAGSEAYQFLDYDNDGDQDFFTGNGMSLALVRNIGGGNYTTISFNTASFQNFNTMAIMDNDANGLPELYVARTNFVSCNSFTAAGTMNNFAANAISGVNLSSGQFVDMDNDGAVDLLVGTTNGIGWFRNLSNTSFSTINPIGGTLPTGVTDIEAIDYDGDGDLDIFFTLGSISTALNYYENLGSGVYELHADAPGIIGSVYEHEFFDSDNDSDIDLFIHGSQCMALLRNLQIEPYQARGSVFVDHNQDGIRNGNDYGLDRVKLTAAPGEQFAFTRFDGTYRFNFDGDLPGSYNLAPDVSTADWGTTTGNGGYPLTIAGPNLEADSLDFGLYPLTLSDTLQSQLIGGFPRCNTTVNYHAWVRNLGTTEPFVLLDLELSPELTYVAATTVPDSVVGQHYYWHCDSIRYFADSLFNLQVAFPEFASMGDEVISTLTVSSLDEFGNVTYSTTDTLSQVIVCAYDPNDKSAEPIGEGAEGIIALATDYIDYLIRFQNTGNDTAIRVVIRDAIDPALSLSEIIPLGASHPMAVETEQNGRISFVFDNIYLPDSATNEPMSHGFVSYRIPLAPSVLYGTEIHNTAHIYFDANPAIVTNTTLHTIERPATFGFVEDTACFSFTSPSGSYTWNLSGTYVDTLQNWYNGDSIVTLDLHIVQPVSTSASGPILTAQGGDASTTWQWILCGGGTIAGATTASFTAIENGDYAVVMTTGECTDTSDCLAVTVLGLAETSGGIGCTAVPNPSDDGCFMILTSGNLPMTGWIMTDVDGEVFLSGSLQPCTSFGLTVSGTSGVYLLYITFSDGTQHCVRLVKA